MSFPNTYNNLLDAAQNQVEQGASIQEVFGAIKAVAARLEFLMIEEYRNAKVLTDWEKAKQMCQPEGEAIIPQE